MKIKIQKVIQTVALKEYNEAYGDEQLRVWVNPPRSLQKQREELDREYVFMVSTQLKGEQNRQRRIQEADEKEQQVMLIENEQALERFQVEMGAFNRKNFAWYAELWSQDSDSATYWTVDEIEALFESDPALCTWLADRTQDLLKEHREREKKS